MFEPGSLPESMVRVSHKSTRTCHVRVYMFVGRDVTESLQMALPFEGRERLAVKPIRRCVRRVQLDPNPDGTYVFRARSFSRRQGVVYRCRVNPRTGIVWCSCRDFLYRHYHTHPSYSQGEVCKHLRRAIRTVRKVERERLSAFSMAA